MLYNDEHTRKEEELFQKQLQLARSFTKEEQEKLMTHVEALAAAALRLKANPHPTEEEAALLERITAMILEANENVKRIQNLLGESSKRQANAYYQHIKKLAAEGNSAALKIYEELKPEYQASLRSDMGDN